MGKQFVGQVSYILRILVKHLFLFLEVDVVQDFDADYRADLFDKGLGFFSK